MKELRRHLVKQNPAVSSFSHTGNQTYLLNDMGKQFHYTLNSDDNNADELF